MGHFALAIRCLKPGQRALRQPLLIRAEGVSLHFLERAMTGHGRDFVVGAAKFSQALGRCLAQAMRRAMRQSGFIAPFTEFVAEALRRVGRATLRQKECLPAARARRRSDDPRQFRHHGQGQRDGLAAPVLHLGEGQQAVMQVAWPQPHDIAPTLAGIERHGKRETRLAANRMSRLVLLDLGRRP
nr:hypothetical protein [Gluconacetobacter dulcium]